MKKALPILCFILISGVVFSQQDPHYSQYVFNLSAINPAYAGLYNRTSVNLNSRFQWTQFEGSPKTHIFSANSSFFKERAGLGLIVSNDRIGINYSTEAHMMYSYKIQLDAFTLSMGLQTGLVSHRYEVDNLTLQVFDDPFFSNSEERVLKPSFGGGILLSSEKWLFGFSVPKALNHDFDRDGLNGIQYSRHIYVTGAYLFRMNNGLILKPMAQLSAVKNAPVALDLNAMAIINNRYWVGLFTNNFHTYGSLLQFEYNSKYRLGYSFELFSGAASPLTSHEFFLGINLAVFKDQRVIQEYF